MSNFLSRLFLKKPKVTPRQHPRPHPRRQTQMDIVLKHIESMRLALQSEIKAKSDEVRNLNFESLERELASCCRAFQATDMIAYTTWRQKFLRREA